MGAIDQAIADELLSYAVDLLRLEAGTRARVLRLLEDLRGDLETALNSGANSLTEFNKTRLQALLKQATIVIDDYYAKMQGDVELALQGVGRIQAQQVATTLSSVFVHMEAALPTETFLSRLVSNVLIQGAPSSEWWSRQDQDTAFRFSTQVRQGVAAGETNEQVVRRITGGRTGGGVMEISARNARALVHTSIQTVANEARRESFRKNSDVIDGIQQLSTLDSHTTLICIAYSGAEWDLDLAPINDTKLPYNGGVPRHWNCRSVEVPIVKPIDELGFEVNLPEAQRASSEGPVPESTTFEDWLSRRTDEQVDEQLGKGRADLWRQGKIDLNQLLNMQGNPLTLQQLQRKYGGGG